MNNNIGDNQLENVQDINVININNNQNNNNIRQNIQNNINNPNNIFTKHKDFTISFLFFFTINALLLIYSRIFPIETSTYIFQYRPIVSKYQFYRMISRYFVHFGFAHFLLEQITFFYLSKYLENKFGTLLTLSIIFISIILVSIINIFVIPFFSLFLSYRVSVILDHAYEGGLTPVIFSMLTFFSLFDKNRYEGIFLENFFFLRMKYSYIYLLGILYFFTPNRSFYGNVSGIIGGFIIKKYRRFLLPKVIWIYEFEERYDLYKIKSLYRKINLNNNDMKNTLIKYDRDSIDDILLNYENININI